jgi:hypothetical protein
MLAHETHAASSFYSPEAFMAFRTAVQGPILLPNATGYDQARKVWNAMIDRRPCLIVQCINTADVVHAVNFARTQQLPVAIRGGAHNAAGLAVCDNGLVIDLSLMKEILVNPATMTARAQGGVLWGEFDQATQQHGHATTGGVVTTTGIAGLTLGGGIGWLMGKYGLSCDNLLSVEIVTADGQVRTASRTQNEELFWAVRGAGGNFGVVTSFEYQLHRIETVLGGMVLHPIDRAKEVLQFYRDFTATAPDELTAYAGALTSPDGHPLLAIVLCYCGPDMEEGERLIAPIRQFGPPMVDMLRPMPYLEQQTLFDAAAPHGLHSYWKANQLDGLTDEAIETFVKYVSRISSPRTAVLIEHHHGAMSRVDPEETAFRHREECYDLVILSLWTDPDDSPIHVRWTREFFEAMKPFYRHGVYVNALSDDEGNDRVRAAYGANYERLVELKRLYDPANLFRINNNIVP